MQRPLSIFVKLWFIEGRAVRKLFDCESLLESNSPDIVALFYVSSGTNLDDSTDDFGSFWARGYLSFLIHERILLGGIHHMHGLSLCLCDRKTSLGKFTDS